MAQGNSDDLAKLLSGMIDGEHPQEEEQPEQDHPEPPAAATPAPPPAPARAAAPARSAAPRPAPSVPKPAIARPAAPGKPAIPAPSPQPAPEQEVYVDQAITEAYGHDTIDAADDAVIVPPPSPEMLAHSHTPKRPVRRQSVVQGLQFKRTIIPIMLTVGALCLIVIGLGLGAGEESPFRVFRGVGFLIPVLLIGLTLLAFGVLTMLQVKNELVKLAQQEQAAGGAD